MVERCHTVVVKAGRHSAKNWHVFSRSIPRFFVALHLFGDIAQGIARAFAVEFVDRYKLGKVEHVDFFELAGSAKFRRHHIHGNVNMRNDGSVALANARCFDNDQVKACALCCGQYVGQGGADFATKVARGQTAHEYTLT